MTHRRTRAAAWLLLALLAPLFLGPRTAVHAEEGETATAPDLAKWSDQANLEQELAVALAAVASAEGRAFKQKPTVQITEVDAMVKILEGEVGAMLRRLGSQKEAVEQALVVLARGLVMKYEPEKHVVHVMPKNVKRIIEVQGKPELASGEMLRITLIHEAAHGMDFQYYPHLDELRRGRETMEGVQAVGAILEGHAQFVAARIAKALGLEAAFAQLVELTVSAPPVEDAVSKVLIDIQLAEQRFAYIGGQKFFEAVYAARGKAGVEQALREPPDHVRLIEQPEIYLDPSKDGSRIDPEAVAAPLRAWSEEAKRKVRDLPFKRSQLGAVFAMLPAARTEAMRAAFKQGWVVVSEKTGPGDMVVGILIEFSSHEGAAAYLTHAEALLRKKDEAMKAGPIRILEAHYEDGAGSDGALPGLVCTKKMSVNGNESTIVIHNVRLGHFAMDITFVDQSIDRKVQDRLVGKTAAALQAQLGGGPGQEGAGKDGAAGGKALEKLVREFRKAQMTKAEARLRALGAQIVPTSADLAAICRKGVATDAFLAAYRGPKDVAVDGPQAASLAEIGRVVFSPRNPARTEVQVHAATTEEIVRYERGSAAFAEFPAGMRRFAEGIAAPGRTWYVVELLEPGEDTGMKYTCFTRVGERFIVLLKPWKALPPDDAR